MLALQALYENTCLELTSKWQNSYFCLLFGYFCGTEQEVSFRSSNAGRCDFPPPLKPEAKRPRKRGQNTSISSGISFGPTVFLRELLHRIAQPKARIELLVVALGVLVLMIVHRFVEAPFLHHEFVAEPGKSEVVVALQIEFVSRQELSENYERIIAEQLVPDQPITDEPLT